ncbi:MAG: flagellar brake domain-containing protein [Deltaproteobacteria bacterium]|nr:flagellar brake domain-containing protein [Deltaproteobacteria bacterium]
MDKQTVKRTEPRLHLPIHPGNELLIEIINLKLRIKSLLVGLEHEQYLIIKIAPNDLMGTFRSDAVKESPMILRYLYKGTVYSFKAQLLNILSSPARLFFVSYPEEFEDIRVLENARFDCILPASTLVGNDIIEMTVVDISKEGCLCMIGAGPKQEALYGLLQVNKQMDIKVQFPGMTGKFGLVGRIRNTSKGTDKIMVGLVFEEMSEDVKTKLEGLLALMQQTTRKQRPE